MKTNMRQNLIQTCLLATGLASLVTAWNLASAQTWTLTTAPVASWRAVACSADGGKVFAACQHILRVPETFDEPGPIYASTDSGLTWMETSAPSDLWTSLACCADGTKLVAAAKLGNNWNGANVGDGLIYISTNSGASWIQADAPADFWSSVACSADGRFMVAATSGSIYVSVDSGQTWTLTTAPANDWTSVACSADGTKLLAAAYIGLIYTSTNSGATWGPANAPSGSWNSVASSADGGKLVAASGDGYLVSIYISADSGATWTQTGPPGNIWSSVACSADGTIVFAAPSGNNSMNRSAEHRLGKGINGGQRQRLANRVQLGTAKGANPNLHKWMWAQAPQSPAKTRSDL
jgi:hypothetical protein